MRRDFLEYLACFIVSFLVGAAVVGVILTFGGNFQTIRSYVGAFMAAAALAGILFGLLLAYVRNTDIFESPVGFFVCSGTSGVLGFASLVTILLQFKVF